MYNDKTCIMIKQNDALRDQNDQIFEVFCCRNRISGTLHTINENRDDTGSKCVSHLPAKCTVSSSVARSSAQTSP